MYFLLQLLLTLCVKYGNAQKIAVTSPIPKSITMPLSLGATSESVVPLSIFTSINYAGSSYPLGAVCTESMKMALNMTVSKGLLPNYQIVLDILDDTCSRPSGVSNFLKTMNTNDKAFNRIPLMLGSICSANVYTGKIMKFFNYVGYTTGAASLEIYNDRNSYETYFAALPPPVNQYVALAEFFAVNGWHRVAILSELSPIWDPLERILLREMDRRNIKLLGLIKVPYISGSLPESEPIEMAVRDIKASDPKIIVIHPNSAARVACWLHRYRLFGPNYVLFVYGKSYFLPNDPFRFTDWCTPQMLNEVLQSVIYFGYGTNLNKYGKDAVDSMGMTGRMFDSKLDALIDQPQMSSTYWFYRTSCYDMAVGAVLLLHQAEQKLQRVNQTLAQWVTSGENFKKHGEWFQKFLVEELVHDFSFQSLASAVEFDDMTTNNVVGDIPTFFQVQSSALTANGTVAPPALVPVGIYQSKNSSLVLGPAPLKWRTADGHSPIDGLKVVMRLEGTSTETSYISFTVLASIFIGLNVGLVVLTIVRRDMNEVMVGSLPWMNVLILLGHIILLAHIFTLPRIGGSNRHQYCMGGYSVLVIGYSLTVGTMAAKLQLAVKDLLAKTNGPGRNSGLSGSGSFRNSSLGKLLRPLSGNQKSTTAVSASNVSIERDLSSANLASAPSSANVDGVNEPQSKIAKANSPISPGEASTRPKSSKQKLGLNNEEFAKLEKVSAGFILGWVLLHAVILGAWLANEPIQTKTQNLQLEISSKDVSIAYQSYIYVCSLSNNDHAAMIILIVGNLLILFRAAFLAHTIRSRDVRRVNDAKFVGICVYGLCSIYIAAFLVVWAFFRDNAPNIETSAAGLALIVQFLSLATIFAPKFRAGAGYF